MSEHLGLPVDRHDDGSLAGMVDALIRAPEGAIPLEITSDHDVPYRRLSAAMEKHGSSMQVDGLRERWYVSVHRATPIARVFQFLPSRLLRLEDELLYNRWRTGDLGALTGTLLPEALRQLGVQRMAVLECGHSGSTNVILGLPGWSGSAGTDETAEWVDSVLARESDVGAKLEAHGGQERHAFIWATEGSSFGTQFALMSSGKLPALAPTLPPSITHVWVAGTMSSEGCLLWSQGSGWTRTGWQWPPVGSMEYEAFFHPSKGKGC